MTGLLRDDIAAALLPFQGTAEPEHEWPEARGALLAGYRGTTRSSVLDAVIPFLSKHEGVLLFMYCDNIGLVTTGIGNLIDPVGVAMGLSWHRPDGLVATPEDVAATWTIVKGRQDMRAGGGAAYGNIVGNDLRLDGEGLAVLVRGRLEQNEKLLKRRFPRFDAAPAPAQLALHGMTWAMGAGRFDHDFPRFVSAVNAAPPDFKTAAAESSIYNARPLRNAAHSLLFQMAAQVVANDGDYDALGAA